MNKHFPNERILPAEPVDFKICSVCRVEQTDGCLLLDMMGLIQADQETKIWAIVEKHIHLDFATSMNQISRQFLICNICWDIVYKFHVFYQMVHENHINNVEASVNMLNDNEKEDPLRYTELVTIKVEMSDSTTDANVDNDEDRELITLPASTDQQKSTSADDTTNYMDANNESFFQKDNRAVRSKRCGVKFEANGRSKHESSSLKASLNGEDTSGPDHEILGFYKRIVCEICDLDRMARGEASIEYNRLKELNHHMRYKHNTHASLRCPVCSNKYRSRVQLIKHKEMHLNPDSFRCSECSEVHHNIKEHVRKKHSDKPHSCSECGKCYSLKARLAVHMRMSHAARDVICDQCNKPFSKYTLDEHKKAVHRASFICEYCPKTFKQRFWLNRHMEEHDETGLVNRTVSCTICSAVVKNKYILLSHMRRMHSGQSAVSCKKCGKSFKAKQDLNKHVRNVCTDRSFPCAACGKQFKQKVKLNEHMTTHTGMSLYVCNFCPQTFKYESYFYVHRKKAHPEQWLAMTQQRKGLHQKIKRIQDTFVEPNTNTSFQ